MDKKIQPKGVFQCYSATQTNPDGDKLNQIGWRRNLSMGGGVVAEWSGQPALVAGGSVGGGASFTVLQVVVPASPGVRATANQCSRVPVGAHATIALRVPWTHTEAWIPLATNWANWDNFTCFPSHRCLKYWPVSWGWWGPRRRAWSLCLFPEDGQAPLLERAAHTLSWRREVVEGK